MPRVELVVLGLLAEGSMHGYDLLERFRERSMGLWVEVGRASVYQALARLERRGALAGRDRSGVAGPRRRVFHLTHAGRAALMAAVAEGAESPSENEASVALGFVHLLPRGKARAVLDAHELWLRERLETLRAERGDLDPAPGAMLDRQEALARAELAWLRGARPALLGRR